MQICCFNCVYYNLNKEINCIVLQGNCDPDSEFCDFTKDE